VFKIEILSWWRLCGKALYKYVESLIETNIDRNGNIVERNASPAAAKIDELLNRPFHKGLPWQACKSLVRRSQLALCLLRQGRGQRWAWAVNPFDLQSLLRKNAMKKGWLAQNQGICSFYSNF